jgi:hypothetical protein
MSKDYNVTFVGDYFTTIVNVQQVDGDEDVAIDLAANILQAHYGWNIVPASTIEIEAVEQ